MIRAVTFDFWQTLYRETPEVAQRRKALQIDYARDFFLDKSRTVTNGQLDLALNLLSRQLAGLREHHYTGVPGDELGQRLGRIVGIELAEADALKLGDLISWTLRELPPEVVGGGREVLSALHGKVKLGMISDTGLMLGKDHYAVMEADGLVGLFDYFTFSDQTGTTKPMIRQFHHTLHRLGVAPAEAVHVGDLERTDVAGAHAAGMRAIRIMHPWEESGSAADATVESISQILGVLGDWGLEL